MTGDAKGGIGVLSFDLAMCIIVPIIYMALREFASVHDVHRILTLSQI